VVHALRGVSLRLQEGDRLGLIGHNGAGKSTLLRVLARIFQPTQGRVNSRGRIVSALNIALGIEEEATGRENIHIRGRLLGLGKAQITRKTDEIIAFTKLGDYIDMPVRIYSSGMEMRLAFSIITAMDSDILLMDEAIGAGDAAFISKAERRLKEFMNRTKILVLASHSENVIRTFCATCMLMEHGQVISVGATDEVLRVYRERSAP
jgi:ABC-type polysaccharide/polyol phosphate transport system ATPase subunit